MNTDSRDTFGRDWRHLAFYVLLGDATIVHEVSFHGSHIWRNGLNTANYFGHYAQLIPQLPVNDGVVLAGHALLISVAAAMITLPFRRQLAVVQLPLIIFHFLVVGTKPSNHLIFLVTVYLWHAVFVADLAYRRSQARSHLRASGRFFRVGLLIIAGSTYLTAAIAKMNPDFLQPGKSVASEFTLTALAPAIYVAGLLGGGTGATDGPVVWLCGLAGIIFTFIVELGVPLCLLFSRCRAFAMALGLSFHVALAGFSALDFSMAAVCTYPFFLNRHAFTALLREQFLSPTRVQLATALLVSAYFWVIYNRGRPSWGLFDGESWFRAIHVAFLAYAFVSVLRYLISSRATKRRQAVYHLT